MFYKEKENDELNNHIKDLQDEIAKMEQTKSINDEKMKAQIRQKEEEILLLEDELSNRRFKTKPIYEQLIQIARDKKGKLDMKELEKEICQSYHDYIIRLKQEYPPIDEQEILMICLKKAGFSSSEIGHFLHCSGSKVRQRIYQLNQKQTAI
jgi:ATP-dependent transcriptional regulator